MKKHTVNVAIYMRVSTKKQADSKLGLEAQERNIHEWLKYNYPYQDYEIDITYFVDEAISGAKFERIQLQNMLKLIQENYFDLCVIYKIDRLARDIEISAHIRKVVINSKCVLCSTTENFDLTTIEGTFVYNINSVFGEYERAVIKKRTEDSQISRLTRKEYPFRASYGYIRDDNKVMQINEDEAKIIRFIFNEYMACHSYEIVRQNLISTYNIKVSEDFISRALSKTQYKGCFVKNGVTYYDVLPVIIAEDVFDTVQKIKKESYKAKRSEQYLYSDLIFCVKCRQRSIKKLVKKPRKRYYYYHCETCNKYINIEKKEYEISSTVCYHVLENKYTEDNTQYINRINYLEKRKQTIIHDYAVGAIALIYYHEVIDAINDEISKLKYKIAIKENSINYSQMNAIQKTLFYQTHVSKIYINFDNKIVENIVFKENKKKK